jgi:hypothetical protein
VFCYFTHEGIISAIKRVEFVNVGYQGVSEVHRTSLGCVLCIKTMKEFHINMDPRMFGSLVMTYFVSEDKDKM